MMMMKVAHECYCTDCSHYHSFVIICYVVLSLGRIAIRLSLCLSFRMDALQDHIWFKFDLHLSHNNCLLGLHIEVTSPHSVGIKCAIIDEQMVTSSYTWW